jgi:hypothetical protein
MSGANMKDPALSAEAPTSDGQPAWTREAGR